MRRIIIFIVVAVFVLGLAGCSTNSNDEATAEPADDVPCTLI